MINTWKNFEQTKIHVALDLGSDTLKIVYAFKKDGREYTGKIVHSGDTMTALPAVAFYDADVSKWYFAEEVTKQHGKSYLTVVKIKRLISLLQNKGGEKNKSVWESNVKHYNCGEHFPKFYFPMEAEEAYDFNQLIKKQSTFVASGYTPKTVCELYFKHIAKVVNQRLTALMKKFDCNYEPLLSIVYPPHVGKEYVAELQRLVRLGFDNKYSVEVALSMTKALSIYASERELLHDKEKALIFNVGEEKTFVAKTHLFGRGSTKRISIDGVEGHAEAIDLGGNDIDRAVANYLESKMEQRETMGSPSVGNVGHIYERGLLTKQYLFLQEIKSAKIIFGMYDSGDPLFGSGVPVNASRDLNINLKLTHAEFAECVGIKKDGVSFYTNSFAHKLCKYVESELSGYVNQDVTHVFISGGVVETYNLVAVIRRHVKKLRPNIIVQTFESESSKPYEMDGEGFEIFSHEDAVYAPAVGCAIASLNNIKVKTVTSLSYGTDASWTMGGPCFFSMLLDKNQEIPEEGRLPDAQPYCVSSSCGYAPLMIFSTSLSAADIRSRKFSTDRDYRVEYDGNNQLSLSRLINLGSANKRNETYLRAMQKKIGFMQRNKDADAIITFHVNGKRVYLNRVTLGGVDTVLDFYAGIKIDGLGVATPFACNNAEKNRRKMVQVTELRESSKGEVYKTDRVYRVNAIDIELRCRPFTVQLEGRD